MKIWIDDIRPALDNSYIWIKTVKEAKSFISKRIDSNNILQIQEINLDHDSGIYYGEGGDYIKILDWLEECQNLQNWKIFTSFKFHSMNPVGVQNMIRVCERAGWYFR